jgi:hypothetical protein
MERNIAPPLLQATQISIPQRLTDVIGCNCTGIQTCSNAPSPCITPFSGNAYLATNYYKHIIQNQLELEGMARYILGNPQPWADNLENCQ